MPYTIKKYALSDVSLLREPWQTLYPGSDMTYYQSFDWNKMLVSFTPTPLGVDACFVLVSMDETPVLIAPLWIVARRIRLVNAPGVYLLGRKLYTDYLNLVYDKFEPEAFVALVQFIRGIYGNLTWHFELLRQDCCLFDYLKDCAAQGQCRISYGPRTSCAAIALPPSKDDYLKMISKSMIGRLRSITNRCRKDCMNLEIKIDDSRYVQQCVDCYTRRIVTLQHRVRDNMSRKARVYFALRKLIYDRWLIEFPSYMPFIDDKNVHVAAVVDRRTDRVAAFISFVEDYTHGTVLIVQVSLNEAYSRYSPGMMCAKFLIDKGIEDNRMGCIDFTRGNEKYKYDLGSQTHYLYDVNVTFDKNF